MERFLHNTAGTIQKNCEYYSEHDGLEHPIQRTYPPKRQCYDDPGPQRVRARVAQNEAVVRQHQAAAMLAGVAGGCPGVSCHVRQDCLCDSETVAVVDASLLDDRPARPLLRTYWQPRKPMEQIL